MALRKIDDFHWEIPKEGAMRVPGLLVASKELISKLESERVAEQVANVATLPGIVGRSLAMPDAHWGYGAPVGGVSAMDAEDGVVSPGIVGYDISCGVRLLRTDVMAADLEPALDRLMDALFQQVPSGVGSGGRLRLKERELRRVFLEGARWAVSEGYGDRDDLDVSEDGGRMPDAGADLPSDRAVERGSDQLGTLGSGNHFLEVQEVDRIYDAAAAEAFGLFLGQVVVLIHTGSRGCGYQICADYLQLMQKAARKYRIELPDPQLSCAPVRSPEGQDYLGAMRAGANFARANRQVITHRVRECFERVLLKSPRELGIRVVYDVAHNVAKLETHPIEGRPRLLCVHRKGATRAFPPGHPELPERYRSVGQPALLPGSMGTHSYVLAGAPEAMRTTFGTTAHGAGRQMSRTQASKRVSPQRLLGELQAQGVRVRTDSYRGLAEEAPLAYKDVSEVVAACEGAGLSRKVARMRPRGVVKG